MSVRTVQDVESNKHLFVLQSTATIRRGCLYREMMHRPQKIRYIYIYTIFIIRLVTLYNIPLFLLFTLLIIIYLRMYMQDRVTRSKIYFLTSDFVIAMQVETIGCMAQKRNPIAMINPPSLLSAAPSTNRHITFYFCRLLFTNVGQINKIEDIFPHIGLGHCHARLKRSVAWRKKGIRQQ